jgi:hypothetical protein
MDDDRMDRIVQKADRMHANNVANNLSSASLDVLKAYIDIQKEIRKVLTGEQSGLEEYPEQLAVVKEANAALEELINSDMNHYRSGPKKQLLNLSSGAVSYLLTFCTGTLLANALDMPWVSLAVIPVCWTLFERFPPMMRATSWSNKHADVTYPEIMRLTERASRDWVRKLFRLNPKYFMHNGKKMTAGEVRATHSLLNAWLAKVVSDDLVAYSFSVCYSTRNIFLKLFATKSFLGTAPGMALSLGTLGLAGMCAGASNALGFQALRGRKYKAENPDDCERGETLVKSTKIWTEETTLEEAKSELIKAYVTAQGMENDKDIVGALRLMDTDRNKASRKSDIPGSVGYEFSCLLQKKSHLGDDDNGEVAGKRVQTLTGYFAKLACLLPTVLFTTFVVMVLAGPSSSLAQQLGLLVAASIVLIMGFQFRRELELAFRAIVGLGLGIADGVSHQRGNQDKYHARATQATPGPGHVNREEHPIFPKTDGVSSGQVAKKLDFSTPAQWQVDGTDGRNKTGRQDRKQNASSSSASSSEEVV